MNLMHLINVLSSLKLQNSVVYSLKAVICFSNYIPDLSWSGYSKIIVIIRFPISNLSRSLQREETKSPQK